MKRTLMLMIVLGAVLLGTIAVASAWTTPRMRANIGFSFYADNQLLPAGEYWFEISTAGRGTLAGSPMAIRSQDGSILQFLPAWAAGSEIRDTGTYLVFNKVGSSYFLRKIQQGELQGNLPKSRTEKEVKLAKSANTAGAATDTVVIAAAR